MNILTVVDSSKGFRGRVIFYLVDKDGNELDSEIILKHPFLIRVRAYFAVCRMLRRQRRLRLFQKNALARIVKRINK
jgi:hypothetical protein